MPFFFYPILLGQIGELVPQVEQVLVVLICQCEAADGDGFVVLYQD